MSTLVTNELFARPGRGDDVANLLIEILGESLQWEGCYGEGVAAGQTAQR
jgi:hypothetical protein